jgi:hypothetical protein
MSMILCECITEPLLILWYSYQVTQKNEINESNSFAIIVSQTWYSVGWYAPLCIAAFFLAGAVLNRWAMNR